MIGFSSAGIWSKYNATSNPNPVPLPSQTITRSLAQPDETEIVPSSSYDVPAEQPRKIILPSINAAGLLQRVNIDQENAIAVPTNIHMAGWFVGASIPGSTGVGIIDGHVQGKYKPGIFKNLSKLKPGDQYSIEYGNRTIKIFEVVRVDSYGVDEVNEQLFKKHADIVSQINLITCGGKFNSQSQQYDKRVLVISKLISI